VGGLSPTARRHPETEGEAPDTGDQPELEGAGER